MNHKKYQQKALEKVVRDITIDGMVRDFCRVIPLPKSEVRRRIVALLTQVQQQEKNRMLEMVETIREDAESVLILSSGSIVRNIHRNIMLPLDHLIKFIKEE